MSALDRRGADHALAAHGADADAIYDAVCDCGNLTRRQLLIWAGDRIAQGAPVFVEVGLFHLRGVVDVPRLQKAWHATVEETDALRLAIEDVDGWPRQRVCGAPRTELEVVDLSTRGLDLHALEEVVRERADARIGRGSALVDATLIRMGAEHWVWVLAQHQLVSDAWSYRVVHERVSSHYRRLRTGEHAPSEAVPQFEDYVAYERRFRASPRGDAARGYWHACYAAAGAWAGGGTSPRHGGQGTRVQRTVRPLGHAVTAALRARAVRDGSGDRGIFTAVASLAVAYLHAQAGSREVVLSVPFANRPSARFKRTAGSFMNVCPVRIGFEATDTFATVASRLEEAALAAAMHQPFAGRPGTVPQPWDVLVNVQKQVVGSARFDDLAMTATWLAPTHRFGALAIAVEDFAATGNLTLVVDSNVEIFGRDGSTVTADELVRLLEISLRDPACLLGRTREARPALRAAELGTTDVERIREWERLWDDTYRRAAPVAPAADFNTVGWTSRYTRQPLPEADMREWVAATTDRILALAPKRVLEIGCGSGMVLCRVAPRCERYVATDLSGAAIEYVRRTHLRSGDLPHVTLRQASAHDSLGLGESFDAVVLSSVVQYFPSGDYLRRVLDGAHAMLREGGAIFVADVRHLGLARVLYASVEIARMPRAATVGELRRRIEHAAAHETELLVDPDFFRTLGAATTDAPCVDVQLRRGRLPNELTRFRYDVTWRKTEAPFSAPRSVDWREDGLDLASVRRIVAVAGPGGVVIRGVPNARLDAERWLMRRIEAADPGETIAVVREAVAADVAGGGIDSEDRGIDPEDLWSLADPGSRDVHVSWSSSGWDRFDVVVHPALPTVPAGVGARRSRAVVPVEATEWRRWTNDPVRPPTPDRRPADSGHGDLEGGIAMMWADLLGAASVGRDQSFFELGGDSLLAYRMLARLQAELGHVVSVDRFLERPTVSGLVAAVVIGDFDGIDAAAIEQALLEVEGLTGAEAAALLAEAGAPRGAARA